MRVALVANPASGGGLDPQPLAALLERHGATVRVHGCEPADLERAGSEGPERVVVAGGDGTIGGAAELAGRLGVPLAVIPTGTANDFARAAGLPDDIEAAAELAATGRRTRRVRARRPRRRAPVRQRRLGRAGVGRRAAGPAAQAAARPARLRGRRAAGGRDRAPARVHDPRGRRRGLRRRLLAGDRVGLGPLRRRLADRRHRPRRRPARRHRGPGGRRLASPAAPGGCAAGRSPSSATCLHPAGRSWRSTSRRAPSSTSTARSATAASSG